MSAPSSTSLYNLDFAIEIDYFEAVKVVMQFQAAILSGLQGSDSCSGYTTEKNDKNRPPLKCAFKGDNGSKGVISIIKCK